MIAGKVREWSGISVLLCLLLVLIGPRLIAEENPLDQLRDRSAEKRWRSLRDRFAERREVRRERKHDEPEETTADVPGGSNLPGGAMPADVPGGFDFQPPRISDVRDAVPGVPLPTPERLRPPAAAPPAAAPGVRSFAPATSRPGAVNVPELLPVLPEPAPAVLPPAPPGSVPPVPPVPGVVQFDSLYQELFALETGSVSVTSDQAQADSLDPHPGLLDQADASRVAMLMATPVTRSQERLAPPAIFLPELPVPAAREPGVQLAQQNSGNMLDRSTNLPRRRSLRSDVLERRDYIKDAREISPFPDYEPNSQLRAEDPTYNLCPPGHSDPNDYRCPIIETLPNDEGEVDRQFAHLEVAWAAPNNHYYPLYFEDVNLERYGHMHHPLVQPFVSVGKFTGQFLALPYQMTMNPVAKPTYPLGYFEPGDVCTPKLYYQVPLNAKAALVTVGIYTGWVYLIP